MASINGIAGQRRDPRSAKRRASEKRPSHGVRQTSSSPRIAIDTPRPSCSPVVMVCGTQRASDAIAPLAPSSRSTAPITRPLSMTSPGERRPVSSTAETAFIGCTGIGIP